jgi:hypothetical protein
MPVERRLSLRDPAVRRVVAVCAALAVAGGLGLHAAVRHMLRGLEWAPSDVAALRAASWLTAIALFVGSGCVALAFAFFRAFRRAMAEARLPPSGPWSFGAVRIVTGRPAVLLGRIGLCLAVVLGLAGVALGGYSVWIARAVLACAAKNL